MGILISSMPDIVKPKRREEEITIPGRNGILTLDEGTYEEYTLSIACGTRGPARLREITAWLDGSGELILSTEADKVYKAKISNAISISDVIYLYTSFLVQFKVFPFKYSLNGVKSQGEDFIITSATSINNKGSVYSQPTITIYGSGNITLYINDISYGFTDVDGAITIDSEMMEVYKDGVNANSKYAALDFPRFEVGENRIGWTGNVIKIEVEPKWRWL
mgnify:CR=1 FL=1